MKTFDFPQYSSNWWAERRGVPTCSCFDKIITPTGKISTQSKGYICQLIGDLVDPNYGQQDDYVSAAMRNGTIMEPEARKFYELQRDVTVTQVGFCRTDDGRFGYSPDSLAGDDGLLELKCPAPKTHVAYLLAGELPAEYKPQLHGGLIVTGRKWIDLMSYCPGLPPLLLRVEPDGYTELLRAAMEQFWTQYQEALGTIKDLGGFVTPPMPAAPVEREEKIIF